MRTDDFLNRYRVQVTARPTPTPARSPFNLRPRNPCWEFSFTHHHGPEPRTMTHLIQGGVGSTAEDYLPHDALYLIADAARLGRDYQEYISDYPDGAGHDQWLAGEKDAHDRCREWAADDTMFAHLLDVQSPENDDHQA